MGSWRRLIELTKWKLRVCQIRIWITRLLTQFLAETTYFLFYSCLYRVETNKTCNTYF